MGKPSKGFRTCRWKGCNRPPLPGSLFCLDHSTTPAPKAFPEWIKKLPLEIGAGLASSLLYELLKHFAEHALFHDNTALKVQGMMARLRIRGLDDISIPEVADFIEATRDPGFAKDMERILKDSESGSADRAEGPTEEG
jgi:hypothetical protein